MSAVLTRAVPSRPVIDVRMVAAGPTRCHLPGCHHVAEASLARRVPSGPFGRTVAATAQVCLAHARRYRSRDTGR